MNMKRKLLMRAIFNRKGRFFVSLFSVIIGTSIIFTLLTLCFDVPNQFSNAFRSYGTNMIFVAKDAERPLTLKDFDQLLEEVARNQVIGLASYHYETVTLNQQPYLLSLTQIEQVKANNPSWLVEGNWPKDDHEIMIGKEIAELSKVELNSSVKIQTILDKTEDSTRLKSDTFRVSGIVTTGGNEEREIFMNLKETSQLFGKVTTIDVIEGNIEGTKKELTQVSEKINEHNTHIEARIASRISDSQDKVLKKIARLFLIMVIFVVLLVSLIISTTTYAMISDRRKEISLKKALGAFEKGIYREFIRENLLTTIIGCFLGIVIGALGTKWVSILIFRRESQLYWQVFLLTFCFLIIISLVSTLLPLRSVKKITIEQILKGE